jgi:hypothetical protein
VFLGLSVISGRRWNGGVLLSAGLAALIGFWFEPLEHAVGQVLSWATTHSPAVGSAAIERFSLPVTIFMSSVLMGLSLRTATGSSSVGAQAMLAGLIASVCPLAPGHPTYLLGAAVMLWNLIVMLSLGSCARDHVIRLSSSSKPVKLGQEGPLATLARGSK